MELERSKNMAKERTSTFYKKKHPKETQKAWSEMIVR
jgi:hypothetical protein